MHSPVRTSESRRDRRSGVGIDGIETDDMLARFASRAPKYDPDNAFFAEDFEELRRAGYLNLAVPAELGGRGLRLAGNDVPVLLSTTRAERVEGGYRFTGRKSLPVAPWNGLSLASMA